MIEIIIIGQDRLLKKTEGETRSDSIESGSKTDAKASLGQLMKLATSNPALNEPFRDTGQLRGSCRESEEIGPHLRHYGARSSKWRDKSRKDTVAKYPPYEGRYAIKDYCTPLEKYPANGT